LVNSSKPSRATSPTTTRPHSVSFGPRRRSKSSPRSDVGGLLSRPYRQSRSNLNVAALMTLRTVSTPSQLRSRCSDRIQGTRSVRGFQHTGGSTRPPLHIGQYRCAIQFDVRVDPILSIQSALGRAVVPVIADPPCNKLPPRQTPTAEQCHTARLRCPARHVSASLSQA
jgi:hypothetical protein